MPGDWPGAETAYQKCLVLDPQDQKARLNLGVADLKQNQAERALEHFDALLAIEPDQAEAHLYAGFLREQDPRTRGEAIPHWQRFVQLAPDHKEAAKIRRQLTTLKGG